tara:strand:- start:1056 stop:1160 length:105 start_codon:yes stop_codon:yes gene_type:complete
MSKLSKWLWEEHPLILLEYMRTIEEYVKIVGEEE